MFLRRNATGAWGQAVWNSFNWGGGSTPMIWGTTHWNAAPWGGLGTVPTVTLSYFSLDHLGSVAVVANMRNRLGGKDLTVGKTKKQLAHVIQHQDGGCERQFCRDHGADSLPVRQRSETHAKASHESDAVANAARSFRIHL